MYKTSCKKYKKSNDKQRYINDYYNKITEIQLKNHIVTITSCIYKDKEYFFYRYFDRITNKKIMTLEFTYLINSKNSLNRLLNKNYYHATTPF